MLRFGTLLIIAATVLSGCAVDVEGIKKGAEELQKEVESSNLKTAKTKTANLAEMMCRKIDEKTD